MKLQQLAEEKVQLLIVHPACGQRRPSIEGCSLFSFSGGYRTYTGVELHNNALQNGLVAMFYIARRLLRLHHSQMIRPFRY